MQCDRLMLMVGLSFLRLSRWVTTDERRFMIIPMLCVTIFVILVVWFLLPRVARLMIHTPTAISIFVCLSMVQLMAVFISMRCTLCGHFLQVALTLILVVGYAIRSEERFSRNAETDLVCRLLLEKKNTHHDDLYRNFPAETGSGDQHRPRPFSPCLPFDLDIPGTRV